MLDQQKCEIVEKKSLSKELTALYRLNFTHNTDINLIKHSLSSVNCLYHLYILQTIYKHLYHNKFYKIQLPSSLVQSIVKVYILNIVIIRNINKLK